VSIYTVEASGITELSGIFNVSAVGSDGSHISAHFPGHVTIVNGNEVVSFKRGGITGCAGLSQHGGRR